MNLNCKILGLGAWGPGFSNWTSLRGILDGSSQAETDQPSGPKPEIIPANERRRAPLPVRLAVETSWQACEQAGLPANQVGCVFASGLGDTDITDYMCRTLNSELKQLSPTKFHNSVHNAAAGYWTISTECMQAANSIAGFQLSTSLNLLEGVSQCVTERRAILLTFFDAPVSEVLRPVLKNVQPFASSILIAPDDGQDATTLSLEIISKRTEWSNLRTQSLSDLYDSNPSARTLLLLENLAATAMKKSTLTMPLSIGTSLSVSLHS